MSALQSTGEPAAKPGASVCFSGAGCAYRGDAGTLQACRELSFTVESGQSVALIGPSGCGKSTTLLMAAGLVAPTAGSVMVNATPLSGPRRETAFIPQDLGIFPWKTVLQNAALGLRLHGCPKAEAQAKAEDALAAVGLEGFGGAFPKELSGGMRQRLALARALALNADLLLMDEPLSAIDALLRESLQDSLLELWQRRGYTQMLVTHSIEEAVFLGQRILVFTDRPGTLAADIANPAVGRPDWRDSDGFAAQCRLVRDALCQAVGA